MFGYGIGNVYIQPYAKLLGTTRSVFVRGVVMCALIGITAIPSLLHVHDWRAVLAAFGVGVLGYLPLLTFTQGLKTSRISVVVPIAGSSPLITVLLTALFLHVHLHGVQWLGVLVILAANIAVSVNVRSLRDSNALKLGSGIPYGLLTALGWGLVFFLIIYPTRSIGPWLSAFLLEFGVLVGAGIHITLRGGDYGWKYLTSRLTIVNALLIGGGTLAFTVGVRYFNVGLVAALGNSMAAVSVIGATLVHHERLTKKEKVLAACMVLGVIAITL